MIPAHRIVALFALILLGVFPSSAKESKAWSFSWQPAIPVNGAPVIFRATPVSRLRSLSGTWLGHSIEFRFDAASKTWYGLGGVNLNTKPGTYELELRSETQTGTPGSYRTSVRVAHAKRHNVAVNVPKKFTEPDPEQLRVIAQDKALKETKFAVFTPAAEWAGTFHPPVTARISDIFGTTRTINGVVQSVHQGLDYAVPSGTPVAALNSGTVLLARPLFFEGNCVVVDHGQGLLTLYLHFSEIAVKEGDAVRTGQILGLSGGTGRATGPHLHIAVRWQGVYVDPAVLLTLKIPSVGPNVPLPVKPQQ